MLHNLINLIIFQHLQWILGKLVLKIPWKNLYNAPVEAAVERLYMLLVPNQDMTYDAAKEEKIIQEQKQAELQRVENAKKDAENKGKKVDDTFIEKITTQIIKNVQIRIKDVHIRYEDKITNPNKPFSFGITLSNLTVETTDDSWQTETISNAASKIFKVYSLFFCNVCGIIKVYFRCLIWKHFLYIGIRMHNYIQV